MSASPPSGAPRRPPGPPGHPLLGNLLQFRRDPLDFLSQCARVYGDVARYRVLYRPVYLLTHPDHIEQVLTSQAGHFVKGRLLQASRVLLGNGLFLSEGDVWLRQRRLIQPAFQRSRVEAHGRIMAGRAVQLAAGWQAGEVLDIQQAMLSVTMQVIAESLFGASIERDVETVMAALRVFSEEHRRLMNAGLILSPRWPTPGNLRLARAVLRLDDLIYRIIRERRAGGTRGDDLLSRLIQAQSEPGAAMSIRQLRDEALTLFVAGYETVAAALAWTWYLLALHPAADEALAAELKTVLDGRPPTAADIPRLTYTEKVIKESLRLFPPAWAIPRTVVSSCDIGGYRLPAGASVTLSPWITHRDPRFYDQPEAFDPDRWTDAFARQLPRFAYFPFGGGPRGCIGASFAMLEAVLVVAAVAQHFRLSLAPGQAVSPWPSLILRPRDGIRLTLARR